MSILHSIPNEISVPEWAVEAAIGVHLFDKRYTTFGFNSKTKTVLVKGEEDWLYIAHTPDAYWPKVGRGHPEETRKETAPLLTWEFTDDILR